MLLDLHTPAALSAPLFRPKLNSGEKHLEIDSEASTEEGIEDKGAIVYLIFVLYGIGLLLPWNVILSCLDFLIVKVSFVLFVIFCRCQATVHRRSILLPARASS